MGSPKYVFTYGQLRIRDKYELKTCILLVLFLQLHEEYSYTLETIWNLAFSKGVFNSIVLPHINYVSVVWGRCPNMINKDRISKLQKRTARVILRCKIRNGSSEELFNTMKWIPFYDRVVYNRCLMMYKVTNNFVPQHLEFVTPVTSIQTPLITLDSVSSKRCFVVCSN